MKKSIVLSATDGGKPVIATLEEADGGICGKIRAHGTVCLDSAEGITFAEITDGKFVLVGDISNGFNLGVFDGGLAYFGYGGGKGGKGKMLAALERWEQAINKPYDDEAIAEDNYYLEECPINPTSAPIACDKQDFSIIEDISDGQFSTSYPHCDDSSGEADNDGEQSLCNETSGFDRKAEKTEETEICRGDDRKAEECGGDGATPCYEKIAAEVDALFTRFPREKSLERAISGSTFVRIAYADEKFYTVGKTVYMGAPEYIIFGVPASPDLPREITDVAYRVPTCDGEFYLIYQSAQTGELIPKQ